jgi:multiple sugar transport system ATP-binding protein
VLSQGRIEQIGAPLELYNAPDTLFVASFLGSPKINLLAGEVVEAGAKRAVVRLKSGETLRVDVDAARAKAGDAVTLGVRPEHFKLGETANSLAASVRFVEALGAVSFAYGRLTGSEEEITAQVAPEAVVEVGQRLRLGVPPAAAHLFDAQGRAFRRIA